MSEFNDPPAEGMEYVAARMRVRRVEYPIFGDDDWLTADASYYKTTDAADMLYDAPWVTAPEPRLEANLYAGGEVEGWAIFTVPVGEEQPLLVFLPYSADSGGEVRYMALQ